jgi:6 kDa early secretory antigenic target
VSEIKVTFGELHNAQNSIQATWRNINQQMEDLKTYLRPMVETWSGDASIAYKARQAKWDQSAASLHQVLNQIGANMRRW